MLLALIILITTYDVSLKYLRLKDLQKQFGKDNSFEFFEIDLENYTEIKSVVKKYDQHCNSFSCPGRC